jgi:hypothetical protein
VFTWSVREESVLAWTVAALRKMVEPTKVPPEPGTAPFMLDTKSWREESCLACTVAALRKMVEPVNKPPGVKPLIEETVSELINVLLVTRSEPVVTAPVMFVVLLFVIVPP